MCFTRQRAFPPRTSAVADARGFTSASLVAILEPPGWAFADDAVLVVSELVTACLETAPIRIEVRLELHYDTVRIEVLGEGALNPVRSPALAGARGHIIDDVTDRAGFDTVDGRTQGVAYLRCDPAYTSLLACEDRPEPVAAPGR